MRVRRPAAVVDFELAFYPSRCRFAVLQALECGASVKQAGSCPVQTHRAFDPAGFGARCAGE